MSNYQLFAVKHLAEQVNDCLLLHLVICCEVAYGPGESHLWFVFMFIAIICCCCDCFHHVKMNEEKWKKKEEKWDLEYKKCLI